MKHYLNTEDAEDDEEGAADEDDVADRSKRGQQGLDDQLETRRSAYYPGKKHTVALQQTLKTGHEDHVAERFGRKE